MTLVEYLSGLFTRPSNGLTGVRTGTGSREPSTPSAIVVQPAAGESDRSFVYECRRCGTTVGAEATICPRCERRTIAEYPVW